MAATAMKERGRVFRAEQVQAIVDGCMTQFRQPVKLPENYDTVWLFHDRPDAVGFDMSADPMEPYQPEDCEK